MRYKIMPYKDLADRKAWHLRNKLSENARINNIKKAKRLYVAKVKDRPCMDCGAKYPFYVMDMDHREGEKKVMGIAAMLTRSWEVIKAELEKCDVVCANCHRIRTYKRMAI